MAKLYFKKKLLLNDMKIKRTSFDLMSGLMFRTKKTINKGALLFFPTKNEIKFGASITMMFVFYPLDILFIDKKFRVVDKTTLGPFKFNYTPKKKCKYVIESSKNKFKNISIGDNVKIIFD